MSNLECRENLKEYINSEFEIRHWTFDILVLCLCCPYQQKNNVERRMSNLECRENLKEYINSEFEIRHWTFDILVLS
jgi:hypothetical protein